MKKKSILFLLVTLFISSMFFAQSNALISANRKTALRCLDLAEKYILAEDWENALVQSELGLSYDNSISDLEFTKASSLNHLNYSKTQVLETINFAFTKDNWVNYNYDRARILYADLLSDTGSYDKSIEILNMEPFIYSADAEFIRIKNYYRMGTSDSISQARARLDSSRKIYSKDYRFPHIFFLFEVMFLNYSERNGTQYEIPQNVYDIAKSYIAKIPDYKKADINLETMALLFCQNQEDQERLLKALGQKDRTSPFYAYVALKVGILSEEKAYNLFFDSLGEMVNLNLLENFSLLLKDQALRENFAERLNSFSGTLIIDEDLDLRNELIVKYDRGRAQYIKFDLNTDGIDEIYAACDYGSPLSVNFKSSNIELMYDVYPNVKSVSLNKRGMDFTYLNDDYKVSPFLMTLDQHFLNYQVSFYIPYINPEFVYPDEYELIKKASSLQIKTSERYDSKVVYTVYEGRPIFANFYSAEEQYAYSVIEPGLPFVRYVDYDNDTYFETAETYDIDEFGKYISQENSQMIKAAFGENIFTSKLYLKKVAIDRDNDTVIEFQEEFLENQGKVLSWDTDGNGLWDYQHITYPMSQEGSLVETIFYKSNGLPDVILRNINGSPSSLIHENHEYAIIQGSGENIFWIEKLGNIEDEKLITSQVANILEAGKIILVELEDESRYSVIKVDGKVYIRRLAKSEVIENE